MDDLLTGVTQDRGGAKGDAGIGKGVSNDAVDRHAVGEIGRFQHITRLQGCQALQHLPAVIDDRGDTRIGRAHHVPPRLDGAELGLGMVHPHAAGVGEPGIVGGDRQQLRPVLEAVHGVALIDGVKADEGSHLPHLQIKDHRILPRGDILGQGIDLGQRGDKGHDQIAKGHELTKRHRVALVVDGTVDRAVGEGHHDGVVVGLASLRHAGKEPAEDGHTALAGQTRHIVVDPGMAVDVGGDAGLGPDDDLGALGDGLAGEVAVDLHHRVHGATAPVLQRPLVALDGGGLDGNPRILHGGHADDPEAHVAEEQSQSQGGADRPLGGMEDEVGEEAVHRHHKEGDEIRPENSGGLQMEYGLGLSDGQSCPRHSRPAAVRLPPLQCCPQAGEEDGMEHGVLREPLSTHCHPHEGEQQSRPEGLEQGQTQAGKAHHHRRGGVGHPREVQGVHIEEPMEIHGVEGPEEAEAQAVETAVSHRGIGGQGKDRQEGGDEGDPLKGADLGEDDGQGEEDTAQGEDEPLPFGHELPQGHRMAGGHESCPPLCLLGGTSHLGTPLPLRSKPLVNQISAGGMTNSRPRR